MFGIKKQKNQHLTFWFSVQLDQLISKITIYRINNLRKYLQKILENVYSGFLRSQDLWFLAFSYWEMFVGIVLFIICESSSFRVINLIRLITNFKNHSVVDMNTCTEHQVHWRTVSNPYSWSSTSKTPDWRVSVYYEINLKIYEEWQEQPGSREHQVHQGII